MFVLVWFKYEIIKNGEIKNRKIKVLIVFFYKIYIIDWYIIIIKGFIIVLIK